MDKYNYQYESISESPYQLSKINIAKTRSSMRNKILLTLFAAPFGFRYLLYSFVSKFADKKYNT